MSGRPDSFMPLYIGDYLADTAHLSASEHGAYLLLLMHYWRSGIAPADDDGALMRICRMRTAEWKASKVTIKAFFKLAVIDAQTVLTHTRVEQELQKAGAKYASRKAVSDAANAAREAKRQAILQGKHEGNLEPSQPQSQPQPQSSTEEIQTPPSLRSGPPQDDKPTPPKPKASRRSQLPEGCPTVDQKLDAMEHWRANGRHDLSVDVENQIFQFRDHHLKTGATMADWGAAWRTWFRNAKKFTRQEHGNAHRESSHEQTERVTRELIAEFDARDAAANHGRDRAARDPLPGLLAYDPGVAPGMDRDVVQGPGPQNAGRAAIRG